MPGGAVRYGTAGGRWVLAATVLGSGIALLDTTVVNVALPSIADDLDAGFSGLQWTLDAYLLTLSALLLLGGSLGDVYGRRRVFLAGLIGFTAASVLCGLAPSIGALIAARALQGVGAALLVPASLALISSTFADADRAPAIGAWSALSGVATAIGPFVGGYLVQAASWRWAFLLNVPFAAVAVALTLRHVPESRDEEGARTPDLLGAVTAALGLGGVVFAFIEAPVRGWASPLVAAGLGLGVAALIAFFVVERRVRAPMLPLDIFRNRQFSAANAVTLALYGALGAALFLLALQLQTVLGYSPLAAGVALLPITVLLVGLSTRAGRLGQRIGLRLPMTVGPIVAGCGLFLLVRVTDGGSYAGAVLPGVTVFGLGLALTVAPLTTAALGAMPARRAGIASGVNNAVARMAGLVAVALVPLAVGISATDEGGPSAFSAGFQRAMVLCGALCVLAGLVAAVTIRKSDPCADTAIAHR